MCKCIFLPMCSRSLLPLLAPLLAGLSRRAGWRGRAPPLLGARVGLALLAIGCTGRLIRQNPQRSTEERGMEDERKSSRMRGWNVAHTRGGADGGVQGREGRGWGGGEDVQGFCAADCSLELFWKSRTVSSSAYSRQDSENSEHRCDRRALCIWSSHTAMWQEQGHLLQHVWAAIQTFPSGKKKVLQIFFIPNLAGVSTLWSPLTQKL